MYSILPILDIYGEGESNFGERLLFYCLVVPYIVWSHSESEILVGLFVIYFYYWISHFQCDTVFGDGNGAEKVNRINQLNRI